MAKWGYKVCAICGEEKKRRTEFYPWKGRCIRPYCKACYALINKINFSSWYYRNREEFNKRRSEKYYKKKAEREAAKNAPPPPPPRETTPQYIKRMMDEARKERKEL